VSQIDGPLRVHQTFIFFIFNSNKSHNTKKHKKFRITLSPDITDEDKK